MVADIRKLRFKFCEEGRGSRWPNDNDGEEMRRVRYGRINDVLSRRVALERRVASLSRGASRRSREARAAQGHADPREHEMPDTGSLSR